MASEITDVFIPKASKTAKGTKKTLLIDKYLEN